MKKVYKILQPRLLLIPPWLSRNSVGHGEPQYLGSNSHGLDVLRLLLPDTIYSNGERINKFKKKGTNNQPKRPSPLWGVPIPHTAVGLRGASNAYE